MPTRKRRVAFHDEAIGLFHATIRRQLSAGYGQDVYGRTVARIYATHTINDICRLGRTYVVTPEMDLGRVIPPLLPGQVYVKDVPSSAWPDFGDIHQDVAELLCELEDHGTFMVMREGGGYVAIMDEEKGLLRELAYDHELGLAFSWDID